MSSQRRAEKHEMSQQIRPKDSLNDHKCWNERSNENHTGTQHFRSKDDTNVRLESKEITRPKIILKLFLPDLIGYIFYENYHEKMILFQLKCDLLQKLKIESNVSLDSCHFFCNGIMLENHDSINKILQMAINGKIKICVYFEDKNFKFSTQHISSKYRISQTRSQNLNIYLKQFRKNRIMEEKRNNFIENQPLPIKSFTNSILTRIKNDFMSNQYSRSNISIFNKILHLGLSFPYLRQQMGINAIVELFAGSDNQQALIDAIQQIQHQHLRQQQRNQNQNNHQQNSNQTRLHRFFRYLRTFLLSNFIFLALLNYFQNFQLLQYSEGIRIFVDAIWQLFLIILLFRFWYNPLFFCIILMSFIHFFINSIVFNMRRARIENAFLQDQADLNNSNNLPWLNEQDQPNGSNQNPETDHVNHLAINEPNPHIASILVAIKHFFKILFDFFASIFPDPLPIVED